MIWDAVFAGLALSNYPLPDEARCHNIVTQSDAALAYSAGLQGFFYGYPIVDLLRQKHEETNRTNGEKPFHAPVNAISVYPGLLNPKTQGQLRAPNADTLYLSGWIDLSKGPVIVEVPEFGSRYYTVALTDLYAKPVHIGSRKNGGVAKRYALIGPSGGNAPRDSAILEMASDIVWLLGRVAVDEAIEGDTDRARVLAKNIKLVTAFRPAISAEPVKPINPFASLQFFSVLNAALKGLPPIAGEEGIMAVFDRAGFGPAAEFNPAKLTDGERLGLGCALRLGPEILRREAYRPAHVAHGWIYSPDLSNPGRDYLLRAEVARGGYVNEPAEAIYPAAIADSEGRPLHGRYQFRIRFPANALPPVDAFWSITAYDRNSLRLTENSLRRYAFGDRIRGAKRGADGSLEIILSHNEPDSGPSNWLPIPAAEILLVARLYLPKPEALDGRYLLPPIERIAQ